ncbi:MAG TPA: hypothetical protein VNZ52_13300, partial [Candidatus Thermoplasmatota archaeon]|nr:hypothetical protein [Candidatus Thermoplasmatota archaeon]
VGVCVEGVTAASCFREGDVCVGFSYQVPQCVEAACFPQPGECISIEQVCTPAYSPAHPIYIRSHCLPPTGAAAGVECYDIYWSRDVGPVTVGMRNSCSPFVEYNGNDPLKGLLA